MSEFDKVIGYNAIKNELMQICDMIRNKEKYEALGAKLPQGILIEGKPGYGKTLLSTCLIQESGLRTYTVRKNKDSFAQEITTVFDDAIANSPSIVFLDDMDKYSDTNMFHSSCAEYVAIQSGIDKSKGHEVLVIGTTNHSDYLPESLIRDGRFDRKYKLYGPNEKDAMDIIRHYLTEKQIKIDGEDDLIKLLTKNSCAEIGVILNDAVIRTVFDGRDTVSKNDVIEAFIRTHYNSPDYYVETDSEHLRKVALHEAGHVVVAETLNPGSVAIASVCEKRLGNSGGFIRQWKDNPDPITELYIGLAGKAAVEMHYPNSFTQGCNSDLRRVYNQLKRMIHDEAYGGLNGFCSEDVMFRHNDQSPNEYRAYLDQQIKVEMDRCMEKTKSLLAERSDLLTRVADELMNKHNLLHTDIENIKIAMDCDTRNYI